MSNLFESLQNDFNANTKLAVTLGPHASFAWRSDPKHLFFTLARYKFCSKMLCGYSEILEIGCADGFCNKLLTQNGSKIHAIDVNKLGIDYNIKNNPEPNLVCYEHKNIIDTPMNKKFDAAISIDVIEHISINNEYAFLRNIALSLSENAPCIIGTPNITASAYASEPSKQEHINMFDHERLISSLKNHFHNVFLFSMNDEVVHTGFYPMAHYLMALAVGVKRE